MHRNYLLTAGGVAKALGAISPPDALPVEDLEEAYHAVAPMPSGRPPTFSAAPPDTGIAPPLFSSPNRSTVGLGISLLHLATPLHGK